MITSVPRVNAVTVHAVQLMGAWREWWIAGSAVPMIVMSSEAMNSAAPTIAKMVQREA
jgi:hypothetical protein